MTSTPASKVLCHLRDLAAAETTGKLPDRQLLERFTSRREEAAFAALVRRHGPLVLGVCRRVLGNPHDAEDAFQATFWVLARKAASIARQESVGGWLYRVAYHTALRARARAASRQKHERLPAGRPPADPLSEVTGRELLTVIDEELQHLPERLRAPLVLCYLEGKTRDEAARQLGWSLGTFKRRLEQGKDGLRGRLARRGLALPAVLLAAGLSQGPATAAVPPLLLAAAVQAGVRAAAGNGAAAALVSERAAALAEGALQTLVGSRLKRAVVGVVAGALLLGAGLLAWQTLAQESGGDRAGTGKSGRAAPATRDASPSGEAKEMTVTGRVLGPDGKPAAGARAAVIAQPKTASRGGDFSSHVWVSAVVPADREGRFRLSVPRTSSSRYFNLIVLAGGPGYALGWEKLNPDAASPQAVLRLRPERVIRGRLVDLEGRPAVGVRVSVGWVGQPVNGMFNGVQAPEAARLALWPAPATTDARGGFAVAGASPDPGVGLQIRGERFAPQTVWLDGGHPKQELSLSLSPAQVIEGTVVNGDSGKPVPHARLTVYSSDDEFHGSGGLDGRADAQGRFRINPYRGKLFEVAAYAPDGEPYLALRRKIRWPRGTVKQQVRLALPRGVLVRGTVTERPSGKAVAGASIQFIPQRNNNPFVRDDVLTDWQAIVVSGPDGRFQMPVLPGRGHLLVTGPTPDYVHEEIGANLLYGGQPGGIRYYPDGLVRLDLDPKTATRQVTVTLRRGVTVKGSLLGAGGKPVARGLMFCRTHVSDLSPFWRFPVEVRDGRFELTGLDPGQTYPVYFLDPKNREGATVKVSGKQAGKPVTVRLVPCGQAAARFVDAVGKPVAGIRPLLDMVITPGPYRYDDAAMRHGRLAADEDFLSNLDRLNYWQGPATGADGRVTLPALIPGVTYRVAGFSADGKPVRKEFTVESGKTRDLGDVRYQRPK